MYELIYIVMILISLLIVIVFSSKIKSAFQNKEYSHLIGYTIICVANIIAVIANVMLIVGAYVNGAS